MVLDLDVAFVKLTNPRMTAGLMVLHSLLSNLKGEPVEPREVRKSVDEFMSKRSVSKQSITNAARRLEEASIIDRKENKYAVNYGYLVSVLLSTLLEMNERVTNLEEEIELLKIMNR
ncbi:MAG: hypothetical protein KAJ36_03745 [Candidatus Thorarchaeota archaeon]|nr:hypothetical protein [Candidatus Thorarchaeota archaeon]